MSIHPTKRVTSLLVDVSVDEVRDEAVAIFGGEGAPSGGRTYNGQALASSQTALFLRGDGTDYDEGLYLTLDGGTTWKPAMFIGGSFIVEDTEALKFGTPGTDVVMTADGTDLVESGTGDHVFVDSFDTFWGTGKDFGIVHNGTNTILASTTGYIEFDNQNATGATYFTLGTDTAATEFAVRNNSETRHMIVTGAGAITIGHAAAASIAMDAGVGAFSVLADTTVDIDAGTDLGIESAGGAISIGADAVAQPVNVATGAAARVITIGNAASASLDMDAGVGGATLQADTTIDIDAGTTLSLNVAAGQTLNVGDDAVAQAIVIGNAAAASIAMDAGVGAFSVLADTTVDIDAGTALNVESAGGAITIGGDAVAQAVNIATGAAGRVITVGNAASASVDIDAGVGTLAMRADASITLDGGSVVDLGTNGARLRNANKLSDRYELSWVAGSDGLVQLNASSAYGVDRFFEILGTNASNDDVTYSAEGGLTIETDGADGDEVIVLPHLVANLSPWTYTTWGTDKQTVWECDFTTGASVTNCIIWAGLKLTNTEVKVTDNDQVYFRFEDDVAAGNWEVVDSVAGVDTSTDTGVAAAINTRYHLKIVIANDRTAACYLNGALVHTTGALTDATDLIPYIGVAADGAAAAKAITIHGQSISRVIG